MNWILLVIIAPALFASSNCIDKYLIDKFVPDASRDNDPGALILFSTLFAGFAMATIAFLLHSSLLLSLPTISILMSNGVLTMSGIILYLYAMQEDEASVVVPFYQLIPVFGFFLGLFVLGESLNVVQMIAAILVIAAAMVLSVDLTGKKMRVRAKVAVLMITASLCYALAGVLFKFVTEPESFWVSAFWQYAGAFTLGLALFIFVPRYRQSFIRLLKRSGAPMLSLNAINEILNISGELIFLHAYLFVPIVLVQVANVFQPFYVFFFGLILTVFFPKITTERLSKKHLTQKVLAIIVMMVGSYFLYL